MANKQPTPFYTVRQRLLALGIALGLILFAPTLLAANDSLDAVNQLLRSGNLGQAATRADNYLANNPRDPQMRFLKALIQQERGQTNQAIKTYMQLTVDYPELPEPHVNLAVIYGRHGERDKERAALEAASLASRSLANRHEKLGDAYAYLATQSYGQSLRVGSAAAPPDSVMAPIRQLILAPDDPISPMAPIAPRR